MGIVPMEEIFVEEQPDLLIDEEKAIVYKAGFDKNQPRGENGQWGSGQTDIQYRGSHYISKEGAVPLNNLLEKDLAPKDIYDNIRDYNFSGGQAGKESMAAILWARENPNGSILIYRGVPEKAKQINSGDWISLSRSYVEDHIRGEKGWKILMEKVPVRNIYWDANDINEFAYFED